MRGSVIPDRNRALIQKKTFRQSPLPDRVLIPLRHASPPILYDALYSLLHPFLLSFCGKLILPYRIFSFFSATRCLSIGVIARQNEKWPLFSEKNQKFSEKSPVTAMGT